MGISGRPAARSKVRYEGHNLSLAAGENVTLPHPPRMFEGDTMDDGSIPFLLGVLINWSPMLLLIGVWIYFMRQMRKPGGTGPESWNRQHSDEFLRLYKESVDLARDNNRLLTDIVTKLDQGRQT